METKEKKQELIDNILKLLNGKSIEEICNILYLAREKASELAKLSI